MSLVTIPPDVMIKIRIWTIEDTRGRIILFCDEFDRIEHVKPRELGNRLINKYIKEINGRWAQYLQFSQEIFA